MVRLSGVNCAMTFPIALNPGPAWTFPDIGTLTKRVGAVSNLNISPA
jgi:hypothetical protein